MKRDKRGRFIKSKSKRGVIGKKTQRKEGIDMVSKYKLYLKAYNQRVSREKALDKAHKKEDKAHMAYLVDVKKKEKND